MGSLAPKIMWYVNFNIANQHTNFGDMQSKIDEIIIKSCIFH